MWTPASEDRRHQGEHLAARSGTAHPANQSQRLVDQRFQTEAHHQRRRHDQPGIGDQRLVVEGRLDAVDQMRYWVHRKCLLDLADGWLRNRHSPRSGGTFRGCASYLTSPHRWIEAKCLSSSGRHRTAHVTPAGVTKVCPRHPTDRAARPRTSEDRSQSTDVPDTENPQLQAPNQPGSPPLTSSTGIDVHIAAPSSGPDGPDHLVISNHGRLTAPHSTGMPCVALARSRSGRGLGRLSARSGLTATRRRPTDEPSPGSRCRPHSRGADVPVPYSCRGCRGRRSGVVRGDRVASGEAGSLKWADVCPSLRGAPRERPRAAL